MAQFNELQGRLQEVNDLNAAAALLGWDQSTYMPPGGATARGRQLATLQQLAHEKFTDPVIGRLLDALEQTTDSFDYASNERSLLRVTRRDYERSIKVPPAFTATLASHMAHSYEAWTIARPANDFRLMAPLLEKTLEISRRMAGFFPNHAHIADPLIAMADYGLNVATLRPLLEELRQSLVAIMARIGEQPQPDTSFLTQHYGEKAQWDFGLAVINAFGYDFKRGRQDKTLHPFMTKFSLGDVRITTRICENSLCEGIFSTFHEAGHALYEQGIDPDFEGTPLADGTSSSIHESQSRLWENLVGRSLDFWHFYYPKLQACYPEQLKGVSVEAFYKAINKSEPSLIRTDADEVTYNLHVIIRFGLELDLLEGKLTIDELPAAWHTRYQESLGITAPDDRDGVLQDVHWFAGLIGGEFQGYTLGNILASQFYDTALTQHPTIPDEIAHGHFATLHHWLRTQIYQHGAKFTTTELVEQVTGSDLTLAPYLTYLRTKYGALYGFAPESAKPPALVR